MKSQFMKLSFASAVVAGALVSAPFNAQATTLTDATWSGSANIGYVQNGSCCQGIQTPITAAGTTTTTSPDGKAVGQVVGLNSPSITASATSSSATEEASAYTTLKYYIELVGPTGFVDLHIVSNASMSTGANSAALIQLSVNGSQIAGVSMSGGTVVGTTGLGLPASFDPSSFTIVYDHLTVFANQEIPVIMFAEATTQLGVTSSSAFIDPFFFADGYTILTSNGIGNSAATPLPAALPLFASGLGALGLLGWRRKKKALTA